MIKNFTLLIGLLLLAYMARAQKKTDPIQTFQLKTKSKVTVDKQSKEISSITFQKGLSPALKGNTSREKALSFIDEHKPILGIDNQETKYKIIDSKKDKYNLEHITLERSFKGIPIYDGLIKFHFNDKKELASINGNLSNTIKINVTPTLSQEEAELIAIKHVYGQNSNKSISPLNSKEGKLMIFPKGIFKGFKGPNLLVYKLTISNQFDIREFVFVDAHTGEIVEQVTGIAHALNRSLYHMPTSESAQLAYSEGGAIPADPQLASLVNASSHTYHLMNNAFGFDSYNSSGAPIQMYYQSYVNDQNAYWNGSLAVFSLGMTTTDIVAHELGHAYIEHQSNLIYSYTPGALNESFADIVGEVVDQLANGLNSPSSILPRTLSCNDLSTKWKVGVGSSGGVLRDMYNPNCKSHPGRVGDPYFVCSTFDQGGVHLNSGVSNHAFALLSDGGTYNGQIIAGIGLTKAFHIFWNAQNNFLTPTSDFKSLANGLEGAASLLASNFVNLPKLSIGANDAGYSGLIITNFDLIQLQKVIEAVELRQETNCGYYPIFTNSNPSQCEGAFSSESTFFQENFENSITNWTLSTIKQDTIVARTNWSRKLVDKNGTSTYVAYATSNFEDQTNQSGTSTLTSPIINIPATSGNALQLSFEHLIHTELMYDGGVLQFSINGGPHQYLPIDAFLINGYNLQLHPEFDVSEERKNPLSGKLAFSGSKLEGLNSVWGTSIIDLSHPSIGLQPGQSIQLSWILGTDQYLGYEGWYVDNVKVYSCNTPAIHFSEGGSIINEHQSITAEACYNYQESIVKIKLDSAPSAPVTITLHTSGNATEGEKADYTYFPKTFTLSASQLEQDITFRIYNDDYAESYETIQIGYSFSTTGNAFAGVTNQVHNLIIEDNDVSPKRVTNIPVYTANFNHSPQNWKFHNYGQTVDTWQWGYPQYGSVGPNSANTLEFGHMFMDNLLTADNSMLDAQMEEYLESPSINTSGLQNIKIAFKEGFYLTDTTSTAFKNIIQVWDGKNWYNGKVIDQNHPTRKLTGYFYTQSDTLYLSNQFATHDMKIRFVYQGSPRFIWAIDDVQVLYSQRNEVQQDLIISESQYLGPNGTTHFYSPEGRIIASIENLSNHDYGCTTVEITRSGTQPISWLNGYNQTAKQYKITPTNNNPSGSYKITFYYTNSETGILPIMSMTKTSYRTVGNIQIPTTTTEVMFQSIFGTDKAYSATFHTGFSSFSLSDAPPTTSLPVTWSKFNGEITSEGHHLKWSTTEELNNEYFEIEHANSSKKFNKIGRIKGSGTALHESMYTFHVPTTFDGINYYRIKQVDQSGKYTYSQIITLESTDSTHFYAMPNPVENILTLVSTALKGKLNVEIFNATGKKIVTSNNHQVINAKITMDVRSLPTGVYSVTISNGLEKQTTKILKL